MVMYEKSSTHWRSFLWSLLLFLIVCLFVVVVLLGGGWGAMLFPPFGRWGRGGGRGGQCLEYRPLRIEL